MFALKYAMKSIARRPSKNMMTVLSVTLAVTLLVGVGAASNGITNAIGSGWWGLQAGTDVEITQPATQFFPANVSDLLSNSDDSRLDTLEKITYSIEYGTTMYSEGKLEANTQVFGIVPDEDFGYYQSLNGDRIDLSVLNADGEAQGIVSSTLATVMDLEINDELYTSVPNGLGENVPITITIVDIFDDTVSRGHEDMFRAIPRVVVNIGQLQNMLVEGMQDHVSKIRLAFSGVDRSLENLDVEGKTFPGKEIVSDGYNATVEIMEEHQPLAVVYSGRIDAAENIATNFDSIKAVLNIFVIMLNLTALLLIINVQSMSLDDRRYNTAVLRAMGSPRGQIFRIFLIESTIIGVLGSLLGLVLGLPYGRWMQNMINVIFDVPADGATEIDQGVIAGAFLLGVLMSVVTAAVPAWKASGESITEELRGISSVKEQKTGKLNKSFFAGIAFTALGIINLDSLSRKESLWYEEQFWHNIDNHETAMTAFGLSLFGIGLILTQLLPRRAALNISAISFLALAYTDMFWLFTFIDSGNGDTIFVVLLLYMVIGSALLVIVNFESIMGFVNKIFFIFPNMRSVSQVTTTQLIKKKGRATLVFTIFTIILIINVFIASMSTTMTTSLVDQYEWRAQGNDIVVNSQIASDEILDEIMTIDGVEQVFAFRSAILPVFYDYPDPDNSKFNINDDLRFRQIIEVKESVVRPSGNWDDESYVITFEQIDEELYPEKKVGMTPDEIMTLSKQVNDDFHAGTTYDLTINYTSVETGDLVEKEFEQYMTFGGFFSDPGSDVFIQGKEGNIAMKRVQMSNDFLGPVDAFGYDIMVTEELANELEVFDYIDGANLFLVKTVNGYADDDANQRIANEIEILINDLDNPDSLSSRLGALVGATTRIIHVEMEAFWAQEAAFWDFLGTFAAIGLVIGSAGMAIIALRSVSERLREIGMMRAIGFSKRKVINSIMIEMVFLGLFGLLTGVINGLLMTFILARSIYEVPVTIPWETVGVYTLIVLVVAIISAVVPGVRASRVPPSQALRYTG